MEKTVFLGINTFDVHKNEAKTLLAQENIIPVLEFSTENPLGELRYFHKELYKIKKNKPLIVRYTAMSMEMDDLISELGIFPGSGLLDDLASGLWLDVPNNDHNVIEIQLDLLQSVGVRHTKAEFVSCPGCGRTSYDLEALTRRVKFEFAHLKGLKIAVMGCIVNGPGEMADADYGCVGAANDMVHIYKQKDAVLKNIPAKEAIAELKKIIIENGDWKDE